MEIKANTLLNENTMAETLLQEFSIPFRSFKKLEGQEQAEVVATAVSKLSENMLKRTGNKNISDIMKSKGDITKVKSYKDFEKIYNHIKISKSKYNDKLLNQHISAIEDSLNLIKRNKSNFQKAFTSGNEVAQLTYVSYVSSLFLTTIKLFFLGFNKDLGALQYDPAKLKKNDLNELKSLEELNKLHKSPKIKQVLNVGDELSLQEAFGFKDIMDKYEKVKDLASTIRGGETYSKVLRGSKISLAILVGAAVAIYASRWIYIRVIKTRTELAEYLRDAAEIIENEKDNSGIGEDKIKKQEKYAGFVKKLADRIDIEDGVANYQTDREVELVDAGIKSDLSNTFKISF